MHEPHLSIAIGDFNSRVGDLDDTAGGLVQLPERRVVDRETVKNDTVDESISVRKENHTRYRRKDIPSNFYRDEYFQNNIETLANEMDSFREGANNIDIVYNNIQIVYCRQMNEYLDPIKHRKTNQKHKGKPWWNEHLTRLWKNARKAEKKYFKYKENKAPYQALREAKENFLQLRTSFDRTFQKCKRNYQRQWQVNVENFKCNNPASFWNEIEKLKPKVKIQFHLRYMMMKVM